MIWLIFVILGASIVVLLISLPRETEVEVRNDEIREEREVLPTEQFIRQHLLHQDGTIRTNVAGEDGSELALSESLGLWMEYLVIKEDNLQFEQAYETLIEQFLLNEGILSWKIENGVAADTNAFIDDIRIMTALFQAGEKTGRHDYIETAKTIANALETYNRSGVFFVDFYDAKHRYTNEEITLSYLDIEGFRHLYRYGFISDQSLYSIERFLHSIPIDNGFFPKAYDVRQETFHFDETVNLIDQVYTALHLERAEVMTDEFYKWLKTEFYSGGMLYGRYDRTTKKRAVSYESASVYALTILYSVERRDLSFAKDVYERMITMRVQDAQSTFYGGYMTSGNVTHSFDNLFPLLAERIWLDEQMAN